MRFSIFFAIALAAAGADARKHHRKLRNIIKACSSHILVPAHEVVNAIPEPEALLSEVVNGNGKSVNDAMAEINSFAIPDGDCDLEALQTEFDQLWDTAAESLDAAQAKIDATWDAVAETLDSIQAKIDAKWDELD